MLLDRVTLPDMGGTLKESAELRDLFELSYNLGPGEVPCLEFLTHPGIFGVPLGIRSL